MAMLTKLEMIEEEIIASITCDKCGREINPKDIMEWQEVWTFRRVGGYGSVFGDDVAVGCELCQHCLFDIIGSYIRII